MNQQYCPFCGFPFTRETRSCPRCGHECAQAEMPGPVMPPRHPAPPPKPVDPFARAYRLTTLGTLVTYAMLAEVSSVVLSFVGTFLVLFLVRGRTPASLFSLLDLLSEGPYLAILLTIYMVSKTIRRRLPAEPPEQHSLPASAFLRCVLAAFGLWGVGVLVGNFPSFVVPLGDSGLGWNSIPLWIVAIVVAPIFEELIFRKLVLDRVAKFGENPAILCSALIFGLAHRNAAQFFLAFLLGLLFARIYLRTGRIVYTMLLHFLINTTATLDEVGVLLWGDGFELGFLIAVGVLVLAGVVVLILSRKDSLLGWPGGLTAGERQKALRCWPVTLVKWICLYSVLTTAVLYAFLGLFDGDFSFLAWKGDPTVELTLNPWGLLYLIPAVLTLVFVLVLTRRIKQNTRNPLYPTE